MKKEYYEDLLKKLSKGYKRFGGLYGKKKTTSLILTKHEIEDLFLLWRDEARNKWETS